MPHLSELHGAATHLAVVAIPVFALLHFARRAGRGGSAVIAAEPWALAAAVVGIAAAGVSGLLVWGQAQTTLRGHAFEIGSLHFWLGIATALLTLVACVDWWLSRRRNGTHHRPLVVPWIAVLIVGGVLVQGYIGGRMTYDDGVGVDEGGQMAQTARGSAQLQVALTHQASILQAGKQAFSEQGLGCATCHGDLAQGDRGPRLAGGRELGEFRSVHSHGLFPPKVVTDREFGAINDWLVSLGRDARP